MTENTIVNHAQGAPAAADLEVGQTVVETVVELSRADLVRYAGASGDFNHIHWNERFAREVGLPNVIAHGMLTMATAVSPVAEWLGDPGAVLDYRTRFTNPVVVPDVETGTPDQPTARIDVTGTIGTVDAAAKTARVDVTATVATDDPEAKPTAVLGRTQVKVVLK